MKLEIKELRHFRDGVRRDILVDLQGSPMLAGDREVLAKVINYGNAFLEREKALRSNRDAILWFDIHFGEPAAIGVTWAFNPFAPRHERYDSDFFWLMWSETDSSDVVVSLREAQEELGGYLLQHLHK